jgi:hypothetical protein
MAAEPPVDVTVLVAPTTGAERNTIREGLVPVAGWQLDDVRFDFDSSVPLPDAAAELTMLAQLRAAHPGAPLALFGHADATGEEAYNKTLAGRRAIAVYALLTRQPALWEQLWSAPFGNDRWGDGTLALMADAAGEPAPPAGEHAARGDLFLAYMDVLLRQAGDGLPLTPADFLAGGADAGGKGDYQGCGEFNPVLVLSRAAVAALRTDPTARNAANAANRRVVGILFHPGSVVDPAHWPCPRALEGPEGCRRRFWSDAATRRAPGDAERTWEKDGGTFACRFYDRFEQALEGRAGDPVAVVRLYDDKGRYLPRAAYRLFVGSAEPVEARADSRGYFRFRAPPDVPSVTVKWGPAPAAGGDPEYRFRQELRVVVSGSAARQADARLANIGYGWEGPLRERVAAFQTDYGPRFALEVTGELDVNSRQAIQAVHDESADQIR